MVIIHIPKGNIFSSEGKICLILSYRPELALVLTSVLESAWCISLGSSMFLSFYLQRKEELRLHTEVEQVYMKLTLRREEVSVDDLRENYQKAERVLKHGLRKIDLEEPT